LLQRGGDNGIFKTRLDCEWSSSIVYIYSLSLCSSGFALDINYTIVKDFCEKHKLDSIEILAILKEILYRVNKDKVE
jgi:hypothetical protein